MKVWFNFLKKNKDGGSFQRVRPLKDCRMRSWPKTILSRDHAPERKWNATKANQFFQKSSRPAMRPWFFISSELRRTLEFQSLGSIKSPQCKKYFWLCCPLIHPSCAVIASPASTFQDFCRKASKDAALKAKARYCENGLRIHILHNIHGLFIQN
jgi:hypothetical protein